MQLDAGSLPLAVRAFALLPAFVRHLLVWRRLLGDPFYAKEQMGTVVVTSVGSAGRTNGSAWWIPSGSHPRSFGIGGN